MKFSAPPGQCSSYFIFVASFLFNQSHNTNNLYGSPSIIRMIKSRRMRWAGHVARMREKMNAYRISVGMPSERDHWEDQDVGGWAILKWI
jgi:hypothetical protein